jgi:hypothetical protein
MARMPKKAKECPASFTRLQNLVKVEATIRRSYFSSGIQLIENVC